MRFQGLFGTPDTIRTCDLQSRSLQTCSDKMLYFQGLYGFLRECSPFLNDCKTIENTGQTGFFGFAGDSSQTVVKPLPLKWGCHNQTSLAVKICCYVKCRTM